jgi:hypothetical protein
MEFSVPVIPQQGQGAAVPATPSILSPAEGATGVLVAVLAVTSSVFSGRGGRLHQSTDWQVELVSTSTLVVDVSADVLNLLSLDISASVTIGNTYRVRCRHRDTSGRRSRWSQWSTFST